MKLHPAIKKLKKKGWKEEDNGKWKSPDTAISYDLEQALRIADIQVKFRVCYNWLANLTFGGETGIKTIDTRR